MSPVAQPLAGRRIVVTRARAQATELGTRLEALGATVLYCPAIRLAAPAREQPLLEAAASLHLYDWIVLTSVNGVHALFQALDRLGLHGQGRFAAVGPATAEALRVRGMTVQAMPAEYVGAEIAGVLAHRIRAGERRVLLIRGAGGDERLPERLHQLGAQLTEVEAYRALPDLSGLADVRAQLRERTIDAITFTSASTVTHFMEGVGALPASVVLAAIGPVTAQRLRELGLRAHVVAQEHTIPGLVQSLSNYFAESGQEKER